ncbi:hypothetical protein GUITHDRAFT_116214 [Guillardia theta CCMP2712]|uniref:RWP-RK domain-containing protein n=1 Tax=Guillardia theta (strain CCMP2712) TaxID=905079 RepID=L1IP27_GUITC|nr:hypothetical protein GUITHDRAFT_116214 [Guillardia theta CCMP2712]EKX37575.1 hypothetical protein GUITHDRAFT_116214 [Guillardia theta CCMP2712]|eukprot:XP_005824555.1 hypothetical protein GUITHDRAFT_116214 [Guillardia theta CCMP2712]
MKPSVHVVFPRRKRGQSMPTNRDAIGLDASSITSLFHLRQTEAAKHLGISLTAMKNACRSLGINKWPYSRNRDRPASLSSPPSASPQSGSAPCSPFPDGAGSVSALIPSSEHAPPSTLGQLGVQCRVTSLPPPPPSLAAAAACPPPHALYQASAELGCSYSPWLAPPVQGVPVEEQTAVTTVALTTTLNVSMGAPELTPRHRCEGQHMGEHHDGEEDLGNACGGARDEGWSKSWLDWYINVPMETDEV